MLGSGAVDGAGGFGGGNPPGTFVNKPLTRLVRILLTLPIICIIIGVSYINY